MANTSTLKKIVAEAKRIQKAHPHMEWKNAIKDASKHIKEGAKTVIKKKISKKGVGYADDRIELLRKTTPILRKLKNEGLTRTKAIKKINKSTKGIGNLNNSIIEEIKRANRGIEQCEHSIKTLRENLKNEKSQLHKKTIRFAIKRMIDNKKYFQQMLRAAKRQLK